MAMLVRLLVTIANAWGRGMRREKDLFCFMVSQVPAQGPWLYDLGTGTRGEAVRQWDGCDCGDLGKRPRKEKHSL